MATSAAPADNPPPRRSSLALIGLLSEGFLAHLSAGVIAFTLPLYARRLGLSVTEIGLLLSLHLSVSLALKPCLGGVADWLGYWRGTAVAIGLRSLLYALFALAGAPWHLYGLQASYGLARAVRDPAMQALLATSGGKQQLASTFAWYQTADGVAGPCGRALAGVLLTATAANFPWIFGLAAMLSILPLAVLYGLRPLWCSAQTTATVHPVPLGPGTPSAPPQRWTTLLPFVGFGVLVNGTARMLHGLMPLLLVEYAGLNEAQAGLLYLVSTAVMLLATPLFGWLCDHGHRELVLLTRSLANVASSMLYLMAPTLVGFACAKACDKVGTAAFRPAWAMLMAEVSATDPARRVRRLGWMSAGDDAGAIAGPVLAGFLWSTWGIVALLGSRIVLALLAEGYTLLLTRALTRSESAPTHSAPDRVTARPQD